MLGALKRRLKPATPNRETSFATPNDIAATRIERHSEECPTRWYHKWCPTRIFEEGKVDKIVGG